MVKTREDIESYLIKLGVRFEQIDEEMWMIHDEYETIDNIVVMYSPPLIIFRVKLMEAPSKNREAFFTRLLELNALEMVHGAYGLEGENIVLIETLELENLDLNEFQAVLEALMFAIGHYSKELLAYKE